MNIQYIREYSDSPIQIPVAGSLIPLGFPSPADDYIQDKLDLTELLVRHPAATFIAETVGDSMKDLGIFSGDLLVVDRSVAPLHKSVIVASIAGEFTCKIFDEKNRCLVSANPTMKPIPLPDELEAVCEGVVVAVIRQQVNKHVCIG